jgi:hypothetical protein
MKLTTLSNSAVKSEWCANALDAIQGVEIAQANILSGFPAEISGNGYSIRDFYFTHLSKTSTAYKKWQDFLTDCEKTDETVSLVKGFLPGNYILKATGQVLKKPAEETSINIVKALVWLIPITGYNTTTNPYSINFDYSSSV